MPGHLFVLQKILMLFTQYPRPIFSVGISGPGITTVSDSCYHLATGVDGKQISFPVNESLRLLPPLSCSISGTGWGCFSSHQWGNGGRCQPLQMVWVAGNPSTTGATRSPHYQWPATAQLHRQKEASQWGKALPIVHTEQSKWVTATGLSTNVCKTVICLLHCWSAF